MSQLLQEIVNEPNELIGSLSYNLGAGRAALEQAAATVRAAERVFITGIGSSGHAGMAVQSFLRSARRSAQFVDGSELLDFVAFPPNAALIMLSRSGKSVEVVRLLDKAAAAGTKVIGITNTPGSPLGQRADTVLRLKAAFDHNVSITMFPALTLVGSLTPELASRHSLPPNVVDNVLA